ncbi:MAG: hypothetical protein JXR66_08375 [Bacteroidales bacterium]|nr:hypothetical protein [Bacteroidales bacterium]
MRTLFYSIILCSLSSPLLFSQSEKLYANHEIIQDIDFLIKDIEEIHPNLYHSVNKEDFLFRVQDVKDQLPDSISKINTWKRLYKILALLKEGHTYFLPPEDEIGDFLRFPYSIKIDDSEGNFIITGTLKGTSTEYTGSRIVSINGISTDSLLLIFKQSTSAENEPFIVFMNELHFDYSIYAIFGAPEYFDVELLEGDKLEKHRAKSVNHIPAKTEQYFTFSIIQDSIGYLDLNRLDSFSEFKKFCKSTFKTLSKNKISNLIIDFRGNGGGDSAMGDELMKYISAMPFSQYQGATGKVSSASRGQMKYTQKNDTLISVDLANHLIDPYPANKRYAGDVFLLIDGGTFSSAGSTAWCINHYNMATTIGTETGGTGMHYGHPLRRELPITGLTYFISHRQWYQIGADDKSTHGLIPDYKMDLSAEDIKNNRDTALDFAIELITQKKQ